MHKVARSIAAASFAVAVAASAGVARAQDGASMNVNGTTITVGGGGQYLTLPDIKFTGIGTPGSFHHQTNDNFNNYGGSGGGGLETPFGFWGGYRVTGALKGFFSNVQDDQSTNCNGKCVVIDPTATLVGTSGQLRTKTDRNVDYWGGSAELRFGGATPTEIRPNLFRYDYFLVGADFRGIDQDNNLNGNSGTPFFKYNETLNTTYSGGYIGFGGEYSLGFLGVGGLWDRMGIRTYYSARAGLYSANTDYDGRFNAIGPGGGIAHISQSDDDLAFIGSLSFEARKQWGPRTSISLWTDYEYISSVPSMRYATLNRATRIEDDSAFATRTMLRLNVSLGPVYEAPAQPVYNEPLK